MTDVLALARKDAVATAAAVIALIGLATIGGFYFFQYVLGYPPCPLCLDQRMAFYISVPLAALLWLGAGHGASRKVLFLGFLVIAIAMLWNTGLSAFHAGVEWKFWQDRPTARGRSTGSAKPATCSTACKTFASSVAMRPHGGCSASRSPVMTCWCRLSSPSPPPSAPKRPGRAQTPSNRTGTGGVFGIAVLKRQRPRRRGARTSGVTRFSWPSIRTSCRLAIARRVGMHLRALDNATETYMAMQGFRRKTVTSETFDREKEQS